MAPDNAEPSSLKDRSDESDESKYEEDGGGGGDEGEGDHRDAPGNDASHERSGPYARRRGRPAPPALPAAATVPPAAVAAAAIAQTLSALELLWVAN